MQPIIIFASVLIILLLNQVTAYQDVSLKNLCPHTELKSAFNQLYNNKPGIQLTNQSDSAALVHQIWTNENLHEFEDCAFTVDSNLYSVYGRFGRGIFAAIKKINFRQNAKGECIDYVRFTFMESKTQKICGKFDDESELGRNSFFNEGVGVIKVHVFVNKSVPLEGLQRSIEIDLLFTAYEQCSTAESFIRCHPTEDNFCISGVFRNDGVHNCPPPYSTDEPGAQQPIQQGTNQQSQGSTNNGNAHQQTTVTKTVTTTTTRNGAIQNQIQYSLFYVITLIAFAFTMNLP